MYDKTLLTLIENAIQCSIDNGYGDEDKAMTDEELAGELCSLDASVEQRITEILIEHVKIARKKYHAS